MRLKMQMKKILLLLGAVSAGVLPVAAEVVPLSVPQLKTGPESTYRNGVFTVTLPRVPHTVNETRGVSVELDPVKFRGKSIMVQAEMRCRGIGSDLSQRHVGGKILWFYRNAGGARIFSSTPLLGDEEQWKTVSVFCEFPANIQSAGLVFGIQQGWGTLEFRNPRYEVVRNDADAEMLPEGFRCEFSPALRKQSARRGVMSPPPRRIRAEDIQELGRWNVNLLRYQIVDGIRDLKDLEEYERWMDGCFDKLEALLPVLKSCGIQVIVDMHTPPGGRYRNHGLLGTAGEEAARLYGNDARFLMMDDAKYRDAFLKTWKRIATRFRGCPVIYGYDLVNEPDQRGTVKFSYRQLQLNAARAIREIDPEVPIIVESNYWCSPDAFGSLTPLPLKNIIYQVHMYSPGEYTHQGVGDSNYAKNYPASARKYPDGGWNREQLRKILQPVRAFQQKYGAKILVGEFSVTRWAPGGAEYLQDCISLFEEYGWDWCYHAFREWHGWSVEHSDDPRNLSPVPHTFRKQVLLDAFKKNRL